MEKVKLRNVLHDWGAAAMFTREGRTANFGSGPCAMPASDRRSVTERDIDPEIHAATAGVTHWAVRINRVADVAISLFAIVLFGPLMLIIALLIRIVDPGPALFSHHRIGFSGKTFNCLKFRTMSQDSEERLARFLATDEDARKEWTCRQKLARDPRVTRLGRFLRTSSLDELPQFFNVLGGEMSIVGPRPIVDLERIRYGRYFEDYCNVRPGLTGLWQVSGRSGTSYRRRIALDVFYCRNPSPALYLWILLKTPGAIIKREGVC